MFWTISRLITSALAALGALDAARLHDHDHPEHHAFAALAVRKDVGAQRLSLFWGSRNDASFWPSDPDVKFWLG